MFICYTYYRHRLRVYRKGKYMANINYWWLFIKNLEIVVDQMEIGEEADVSRLAGADHKHVKEHYDAADVGDKLIISVFGSVTEVHGLGEITYMDDEVLRFRKTGKLKKHIGNGSLNNDSMMISKGFCDEKGTLKPLDEETYNHIVEDIIGLDNLTYDEDFKLERTEPSVESPVEEKISALEHDAPNNGEDFSQPVDEEVYNPIGANDFSWMGQNKKEEKVSSSSDDENFEIIKKLIIKIVEKADSKEELIEDLRDIL